MKATVLTHSRALYQNTLVVGISVLVFLLCIQLLGDSLHTLGGGYVAYVLNAIGNPAVGLFIGLLSTAILQSSSTTTSMAVAAVATGSLSMEAAVPFVMGANVGTTLTSTLVSLSYVTKNDAFQRAVAAGTVHDFFNVLTVIILFPLEIRYGLLSNVSYELASWIGAGDTAAAPADKLWIYQSFEVVSKYLLAWFGPFVVFILSIVMLLAVVKIISNLLYKKLVGKTREQFESVAFSSRFKSFGWGFLLTSVVQSSSLTTSLIVPLAATGKITIQRAFQFIMGANLGTTITAIIAAMFKSEAAISLAIAHFLFNGIGVLLFMTIPMLSKVPVMLAERLAQLSIRFRMMAFAYILLLFFVIPFTLIYFSNKSDLLSRQAHPAPARQAVR